MNVSVQELGDKCWTFRVLTLDDGAGAGGKKAKAVHMVGKAACHPMSSFYEGNGRNWIIYHQTLITSHIAQLRELTAIQPKWLWQTNPEY